jgi:hypothetical protein
LILLLTFIVTSTLFNISDGNVKKAGKIMSAQTQTSNAVTTLKGILGPPLYYSNFAKITSLRVIDAGIPKPEMYIIEKGTIRYRRSN